MTSFTVRPNPIWPTDPATGAFIPPSINAPGSPLNNPFGLNMAYDGTYLYYNNGAYCGDNTIYKLDPDDRGGPRLGQSLRLPLFTRPRLPQRRPLRDRPTFNGSASNDLRRRCLDSQLVGTFTTNIVNDSTWSAWRATRTGACSGRSRNRSRPAAIYEIDPDHRQRHQARHRTATSGLRAGPRLRRRAC